MRFVQFFGFMSMLLAMDVIYVMQDQRGDDPGNAHRKRLDEAYLLQQEKEEIIKGLRNVPVLSKDTHRTYKYVQKYHRIFGQVPPDELLAPLFAAAMRQGDTTYMCNLDYLLKTLREQDKLNRGLLTAEDIKQMQVLLDSFQNSPKTFQREIDEMYPMSESRDLDEALREAAKHSLLIQRWVKDLMETDKDLLLKAFEETDMRGQVFDQRMGYFIQIYTLNSINRLIIRARTENDYSALAQAYQLVNGSYLGLMKDVFPYEIEEQLYQIELDDRSRKYLSWRLMEIAHVKRHHHSPYWSENLIKLPALHNKARSQMLHLLSPFLDHEQKAGNPIEVLKIAGEFFQMIKKTPFKKETPARIVNNIFWNKINIDIPRIIQNHPQFSIFAQLTEEELGILLAPSIVQDVTMEPLLLDDDEKDPSDIQAKKKPKKKRRPAKKKTKKQHLTELREEQESELFTVSKDTPLKIEREKEKEIVEILKEPNVIPQPLSSTEVAIEYEAPIDPFIIDRVVQEQPIVVEELSKKAMEKEPEILPEVEQREIDAEMQAFWAKLEEYKDMKKANQARYSKDVQVVHKDKMDRKKEKVVAFLPTDEIRVLHKEASNVYYQNDMSKMGPFIANRGGKVKFQWVFDPSVIIDRNSYLFLCQVFHVIKGHEDRLNFDTFVKTFSALAHDKKSSPKKAAKSANRTVFQFSHVIETESTIYIPPIGGVHPEHKSSRFNLSQVTKLLEHGGAHPYFFKLLE